MGWDEGPRGVRVGLGGVRWGWVGWGWVGKEWEWEWGGRLCLSATRPATSPAHPSAAASASSVVFTEVDRRLYPQGASHGAGRDAL